jgi:hypothetical protein
MAESRRRNPATPEPESTEQAQEQAAQENGNSASKAKEPALYHVYTTGDEGKTLTWLKDVTAKTAEAAVSAVVGDDQSLVGKEIVVAPQRNLKTFKSEVETKTKVKVSAA